jgi:hypothetical protein
VFTFISDDFFKNRNARLIAKGLELLPIPGDISAFINLKSPKRQVWTADSIGKRVSLAIGIAGIAWLCSTKCPNSSCPQVRMVFLRHRKTTESVSAMWIGLTSGKRRIGMKAFHL